MNPLLTITDTCRLLKLHRNTVAQMIRDGRLRAINISAGVRPTWRIMPDSLMECQNLREKVLALDIRRRIG